MNIRYETTDTNIDWELIPLLLEKVGMSFTKSEIHKKSFQASYSTIFVFDDEKLIGFGRLLSDGLRQSAMYDVAVEPEYQGYKIGQRIVSKLIESTPDCNFILYALPGKEGFYLKQNFKKMKTGMALFVNPQRMIDAGFVEE